MEKVDVYVIRKTGKFCVVETFLKWLAGNGESGYADGDLDSAKFSKPSSFAVDYKGNVYVADSRNHAIRKITQSGRYMENMC